MGLIWKQGLCRCHQLKMRSCWTRVVIPIAGVFTKRGGFGQTQEKGPCDHGAPQSWRRQEGPPQSLWSEHGRTTPGFGASGPRTVRGYVSVALTHPVCGDLLWPPWKMPAPLGHQETSGDTNRRLEEEIPWPMHRTRCFREAWRHQSDVTLCCFSLANCQRFKTHRLCESGQGMRQG